MIRKIISFLLTAAMLFSILLFSSCRTGEQTEVSEKNTIVLTPKEKFLESYKYLSAYLNELPKSFGFDTDMAPAEEGKMEANSFAVKLNKLNAGNDSYITEPISISGETYNDAKNNILRTLGKLILNGETVRFELIRNPAAVFFNLNKVTEKTLKFPIEQQEDSDVVNADVKLNEYLDYFMDNLSDDLFTAQSGKVTVDGVEFDGETVTLKASVKQFNEALIKVLEKAKTDAQIAKLLKMANITNINGESLDSLSEVIDKAIKSLQEEIDSAKDGDSITVTVISENKVLRSFTITGVEDGKKDELSLTTTVKDGAYFVKGYGKNGDKTLFDFSYQQKPNDKGSCDGQLIMTFDLTKDADESEDTSETDITGGLLNEAFNLQNLAINVTFNGQKTDNKVAIDAKVELTTEQNGLKITVPVNVAIKYEKVSDSENNYSVNIGLNFMGYSADITISGGRSLIPYTAAEVPTDDEVQVVDEKFDITALITKLMTAYPGIAEWLNDILGLSLNNGSDEHSQSGKYIYTDNEELSAYLNDDGTGWLCPVLHNVKYADGQYTAELYDGTKLSGTYKQNGTSLVIDDVGGYTYVMEDGLPIISNDEVGSFITFTDKNTCLLQTYFEYRIENGKIKIQLYTGGVLEYTYQESGDKIIINGVSFNVSRFSDETGYQHLMKD